MCNEGYWPPSTSLFGQNPNQIPRGRVLHKVQDDHWTNLRMWNKVEEQIRFNDIRIIDKTWETYYVLKKW